MSPGNKIPLDVNEPLYIIELGTGSGKFSFYMLKALEEMQSVCDFPMNKIVYVMTDFTETNFDYWATHPSLKVINFSKVVINVIEKTICALVHNFTDVTVFLIFVFFFSLSFHRNTLITDLWRRVSLTLSTTPPLLCALARSSVPVHARIPSVS